MQITLSRKTLLVVLLVIAVILLIVSFLLPGKGESAAAEATVVPDAIAMATVEDRIRTPRAWTMVDGVQAVTGRATFAGENRDVAYIVVRSGELEITFVVDHRTGVFSTADMRPNQPAPTVENPRKVLRTLHDTPVLVRYEPGDPPCAYSILVGDSQ